MKRFLIFRIFSPNILTTLVFKNFIKPSNCIKEIDNDMNVTLLSSSQKGHNSPRNSMRGPDQIRLQEDVLVRRKIPDFGSILHQHFDLRGSNQSTKPGALSLRKFTIIGQCKSFF